MDPFAPPSDDTRPPDEGGRIDVGQAIADGGIAFARNLPQLIGATLLAFVVYVVSICTCLGWIVALPALLWGMYALWLKAFDERASALTVLDGFRDLGHTWPRATGLILLLALLHSPVLAVGITLGVYTEMNPEAIHPLATAAISQLTGMLWMVLVARLQLAPFAMVERDERALQSFATSWEITRGQGLAVAALFFVDLIAMLPGQMINLAATTRMRMLSTDATDELILLNGVSLLGTLVLVMGTMFGMLVVTAGWRQLAPDRSDLAG